jgi:hypothetical protein
MNFNYCKIFLYEIVFAIDCNCLPNGNFLHLILSSFGNDCNNTQIYSLSFSHFIVISSFFIILFIYIRNKSSIQTTIMDNKMVMILHRYTDHIV